MSGRRFAYAGVVVGLVVSVWANVAHASTAPETAPGGWPKGKLWNPETWHPEMGAVVLAGFWPLILFLSLEVLTRTTWRRGKAVLVARSGVAVVASVAAVTSYLHLHGLLAHYGEQTLPAAVGPLAIDGLMAVSAAALLAGSGPEPATTDDATAPVLAPVDVVEPPPIETAVPWSVAGGPGDGSPTEPATDSATTPPVEAPPAAPVAAPVQRSRTTTKPAGKAAAPKASDADLLARLDAAVEAGELAPAGVTLSAVRRRYGVGADRAKRVADTWHARHRRTVVEAVTST